MLRNTAGQHTSAQMIARADGTDLTTGTTSAYVTKDDGTRTAGGGTVTHKGGGQWQYAWTQAETDADEVALQFVNAAGISVVQTFFPIALAVPDEAPVGEIATAVWAAAARTLTAGTNIVLAKGTGVTGFNDLAAAAVNAEVDAALADVGLTTTITGRIDAAVSTRSTFAGGAVASVTGAVGSVTAPVTAGTVSDKTGYALAVAPPTAAAVADAVWDEAVAGHATTGTYGLQLGVAGTPLEDIAAAVRDVDNTMPATDSLGAAINLAAAGGGGGEGGATAAEVWAYSARTLTAGTNIVLAKGTGLTGLNDIAATAVVSGGAITTSGGAVSTVTTAGAVSGTVNATLVATGLDAITATTPTGVPTTFPQKMVLLYHRFFGKAVKDDTAGTIRTFAANGSTVITTQVISATETTETQGAAS